MEELLKKLVEMELAKATAAAQPAPEVVQKAQEPAAPALDLDALVAKITESVLPKVEEMVAKAKESEEPGREEGAGRPVASAKEEASGEIKTLDDLVAKASKGHKDLSIAERNAVFDLTSKVLGEGLSNVKDAD